MAFDDLKQSAIAFLKDDNQWISRQFGEMERKTGVPREQLAGVAAGLFSVYLIVGYFAQFVCNFVGFAYPAYASMLAIESTDKSDDTQWLTYWTVYAVFSLIDFAADTVCGWFPFYWLAKCIFLIYLYHPLTMGAKNVYVNYARPYLLKFTEAVNKTGEVIQEGQIAAVNMAAQSYQAPAESQTPPPAQ